MIQTPLVLGRAIAAIKKVGGTDPESATDFILGPGEYRLLPADLTLPARSRRYTPMSAEASQSVRGPKFPLQRSGAIVFRPRRGRLSWCGPLF